MSRADSVKAYIYYYGRRGWYNEIVVYCDGIMARKGKEPMAIFWKAFGLGMSQGLERARRELEVFHNRRDLQLPVTVALLYFAKEERDGDVEFINSLEAEMAVAEEMAKDAGLIMAARFCLLTGDLYRASKFSQKILQACNGSPSTPFEMEAQTVDGWVAVHEGKLQLEESETRNTDEIGTTTYRRLQAIEDLVRGRGEQFDVDMLMLHAASRDLLDGSSDLMSIYGQVIAIYPQFVPVLAEKSLLLAKMNKWDQALDFAQQALDVDRDYYDALLVVAVHAFTQESQPQDALRKLDDLYNAYVAKEPTSVRLATEASSVFSAICARQPRALEVCVKFLNHAKPYTRNDTQKAALLCKLGRVHFLQGIGGYESAMNCFKESSKIDPHCIDALEGMILCQLSEGLLEDAEGQIELLGVMNTADELSAEFYYLKALLIKHKAKNQAEERILCLDECRRRLEARISRNAATFPFEYFVSSNADLLLRLAVDYTEYAESNSIAETLMAWENNTISEEESLTLSGAKDSFGGHGVGVGQALTTLSQHHAARTLISRSVANAGASASKGRALRGHADSAPMGPSEISKAVSHGLNLLKVILSMCPGMTCIYVEMSRCYVAHNMLGEAARILNQCLALQPHCSAALIALASLEIRQHRPGSADKFLEQALSCDFGIRSVTLFRLMSVIIKAQQDKTEESLAEVEELVALPEVRSNNSFDADGLSDGGIGSLYKSSTGQVSTGGPSDMLRLTNDDRVCAFIVQATLLSKLRRLKEANKVLGEAKIVFSGLVQETQLLVASSQLAVERKDYDSAVRMLNKIEKGSSSYAKAQMLKANILLKHNRDKEGYCRCFTDLIDLDPSAKNYVLLGDAYIKILNPEGAVNAFEIAYTKDSTNTRLRARIGLALIATHEYHRALKFYEDAIQDASTVERVGLSHDLARLYTRLGRTDESEKVLRQALCDDPGKGDLTDMQHNVSSLVLLADIKLDGIINLNEECRTDLSHKSTSSTVSIYKDALETLQLAYDLQKTVVHQSHSKIGVSGSENHTVIIEKCLLSDLCRKMAILTKYGGDLTPDCMNECDRLLQESISLDAQNTKAMLAVAFLNKDMGNLDKCSSLCRKVILAGSSLSEQAEASILLSDVLFAQSMQGRVKGLDDFTVSSSKQRKKDDDDEIQEFKGFDDEEKKETSIEKQDNKQEVEVSKSDSTVSDAVEPLESFLNKFPNHYRVLQRLIVMHRRLGRLDEIPRFMNMAKDADGRAESHPGFRFCKGLYARFTNDIGAAIVEFNLSRGDDVWGCESLEAMIDLYLNPNQDAYAIWDDREPGPLDDAVVNNLSAADTLLLELKSKSKDDRRVKVLENLCLLFTRSKGHTQAVLESFIEMLEMDQDYLPAILGLATAYMVDKEQHKAKNLLKRVARLEPYKHNMEDFAKTSLLHARLNIEKGRFDVAQDAIRDVLGSNRSSSAAWELMGLVMEKGQDYAKAAACYEKAWRLEFESNASIGYKLAFSHMRSGKYIESINVCEAVLQYFPDYPRIKEDILSKCIELL